MADAIEALREGDIYRWRYRKPDDERQYGSYHCCSQIAIVNDRGRLRDTFWAFDGEGRSFGQDDLSALHLTRLANLAELDNVSEHQADYYDDADIVNLNHSNSTRGNFYLRKGAKKSVEKMLQVAKRKLAEAEADEREATRRISRFNEAIFLIGAGRTDVYL